MDSRPWEALHWRRRRLEREREGGRGEFEGMRSDGGTRVRMREEDEGAGGEDGERASRRGGLRG
jgi:hypothetical protein